MQCQLNRLSLGHCAKEVGLQKLQLKKYMVGVFQMTQVCPVYPESIEVVIESLIKSSQQANGASLKEGDCSVDEAAR